MGPQRAFPLRCVLVTVACYRTLSRKRGLNLLHAIAFADAGGRIVHIADLEPHSTELVWSGRPAKLALEMNRGWFARRGVFVGDVIQGIPRVPVD